MEVYGELASQALQVPVSVLNLATNDQLDSTRLLSRVLDDHTYRTALAGADLITLTIGNNDESGFWGCSSDDACSAAQGADAAEHRCDPARDRESPGRATDRHPGHGLLRHGHRRSSRQPPAEKLAAFNAMICEVAEANGAVCVDLVPAFNGPDGNADAGDLLAGRPHPCVEGRTGPDRGDDRRHWLCAPARSSDSRRVRRPVGRTQGTGSPSRRPRHRSSGIVTGMFVHEPRRRRVRG